MVGIGANIAGRAIKNSLSNLDDKNKNLFTSWMNLPGTPINYGDTTGMAPMVKNMTTSQKNAYQAPLSQSTIPMAVQNIMNQSTPFSSKQSTSTGAGAGTKSTTQPKATSTGTGAKSAPVTVSASASAPKTTPKVTVTLPNGTKTTGFINPKDNRTYYDSGFTKPVTTAGAKVTVITGKNRKDFTVGGKTSGETKAETATDTNAEDTNAEDTNAETAESTEVVDYNALAGEQAQKEIDQRVANINNFLTRLESSRNQAVIGAERQAEMARQGMENQMFQNWLGVRQAMTNRGMTGSGIAEDANTRLGMARQQELSNLFTNLSTEINKINEDARLTKQEKEQQILDLQNSYNDLQRQIASGMLDEQFKKQQAQAEIQQNIDKQNLEFAKVFGFDPKTGIKTVEAQQLAVKVENDLRNYGLDIARLSGYLTSKNDKGETVSIPTLDRDKFVEDQRQAQAARQDKINATTAQLIADGQKAQAKAYGDKATRIDKSLKSTEETNHKVYKAMADVWAKIPEKERDKDAGIQAKANLDNAWQAWLKSVNELNLYNSNPSEYIKNSTL